jgi:hypothetical protein
MWMLGLSHRKANRWRWVALTHSAGAANFEIRIKNHDEVQQSLRFSCQLPARLNAPPLHDHADDETANCA